MSLWDVASIIDNQDNGVDCEDEGGNKKRKTNGGSSAKKTIETKVPLGVLEGHTQSVSALCWPFGTMVYSGELIECVLE